MSLSRKSTIKYGGSREESSSSSDTDGKKAEKLESIPEKPVQRRTIKGELYSKDKFMLGIVNKQRNGQIKDDELKDKEKFYYMSLIDQAYETSKIRIKRQLRILNSEMVNNPDKFGEDFKNL
jgi:hypothetical protein